MHSAEVGLVTFDSMMAKGGADGSGGGVGGESASAVGIKAGDMSVSTFCSADLTDQVHDITWAPKNSTCFAACMGDGRVEVWDLAQRAHDAVVVHRPRADAQKQAGVQSAGVRDRTFIRFATNSPVLVSGDGAGVVDVMRMHHCNNALNLSHVEQQERLFRVLKEETSKN